jgi:[protein-PII] uridylyltransferase
MVIGPAMIEPAASFAPLENDPLSALGPLAVDGAWGKQAREYLARARDLLFEQYLAGASGRAIVEAQTRIVDHVVQTLFAASRASYAERYTTLDQRLTLAAQGGYGRGELNPCSDIDLLFLYPHRPDSFVETVTEKMLYTLWDTGLTVGHGVRNLRECVRLAARDLKVKTSLLDTRFLAGDPGLYEEFSATMEDEVLKRNAQRFFREKVQENVDRHRRYGDSVYLVEPQIKEGEGGLRDIHTAMWLAKVKYKLHRLDELVQKGVITEREQAEIVAAQDFLWRVRNGMHFRSGQHQDQLTFELQERISDDLGYRDVEHAKGVEQFMRAYYLHAANVNRFSDEVILRCLDRPSPYRFLGRLGGREIRPGVRVTADELVIGDAAIFRTDPSLLVRAFSDSQRHGVALSNATRRLIRTHAFLLDAEARRSRATAAAFLDVLGWKTSVCDTLVEMHKLEVLDHLLPEFARLRCMAQYDRYHIYTVDEHTLRGVYFLEQLRHGEFKAALPQLTEVMRNVDKIELLYLAMFYHDAGKGLGGDHSNRGAAMAADVAQRLHLNDDDAEILAKLVRHHLLMHRLATRRDIHDPKLVLEFAHTLGSPEVLNLLYVLTFADLNATNPVLWNSWQDMLLGELYVLATEAFERDLAEMPEQSGRADRVRARVAEAVGAAGGRALERFLADMPDRYFLTTPEEVVPRHFDLVRRAEETPLVAHVEHFPEREFSEFTVVTRDQPGLFAKLTGVLRAQGMNIVGATITTGGSGTVIDVFRVSHLEKAAIARSDDRWERIELAAAKVVAGELDVEEMVRVAARPSVLGEKIVPHVSTSVEIDNRVSEHFTVIEVHTRDRVGVLFAITNAIYHLGLSIHLAKISTTVDRVMDVFYVTDVRGHKIEDPAALEWLRQELLAEIEPYANPTTARG